MAVETFEVYTVKITVNTFANQKIESVHFYSSPPSKSLPPVFYHYSPDRQELHISPKQRFLKIFPEQKDEGEDYGVEKITKTNKGNDLKF